MSGFFAQDQQGRGEIHAAWNSRMDAPVGHTIIGTIVETGVMAATNQKDGTPKLDKMGQPKQQRIISIQLQGGPNNYADASKPLTNDQGQMLPDDGVRTVFAEQGSNISRAIADSMKPHGLDDVRVGDQLWIRYDGVMTAPGSTTTFKSYTAGYQPGSPVVPAQQQGQPQAAPQFGGAPAAAPQPQYAQQPQGAPGFAPQAPQAAPAAPQAPQYAQQPQAPNFPPQGAPAPQYPAPQAQPQYAQQPQAPQGQPGGFPAAAPQASAPTSPPPGAPQVQSQLGQFQQQAQQQGFAPTGVAPQAPAGGVVYSDEPPY